MSKSNLSSQDRTTLLGIVRDNPQARDALSRVMLSDADARRNALERMDASDVAAVAYVQGELSYLRALQGALQ
jgi:hypothetical protein